MNLFITIHHQIFNKMFLLGLCIVLFVASCKKADTSFASPKQNKTERFLQLPLTATPQTQRIVAKLRLLNDKTGMLNTIVNRDGYALWEKLIMVSPTEQHINIAARSGNATDTIILIPLVPENGNSVNAFIYAKLSDSVHLELYRANDYSSYTFGNFTDSIRTAEKLAVQFMILDLKVFGHKDFKVLDNRLFKNTTLPPSTLTRNHTLHIEEQSQVAGGQMQRGHFYVDYDVCSSSQHLECNTPGNCCTDGSCSGCEANCWKTTTQCERRTVLVFFDDDDDGGGGGSPGGGGGEPPNNYPPGMEPCNPTPELNNGLPPCPRGNTIGWMPVLDPWDGPSLPLDSLPNILSRSCDRQMDSLYSWGMTNGFREQSFIIVKKNNLIYPKNFLPGFPSGDRTRVNYSLVAGEELMAFVHIHAEDTMGFYRTPFSPNDFWEFSGKCDSEGYTAILEIGNARYAFVLENKQKKDLFAINNRGKKLEIKYVGLIGSGTPAETEAAWLQLLGSSSMNGIGIYKSTMPDKNSFIKLNP